jgi:antitoxin component of RelBE/YafQ-DinJ toxin-antitoxin module
MTYLLRDVDDTVWRAAQDRAKAEGLPMSTLIRLLVLGYAEGRVTVVAESTKRPK